jgi:hypothetical protein
LPYGAAVVADKAGLAERSRNRDKAVALAVIRNQHTVSQAVKPLFTQLALEAQAADLSLEAHQA